MPGISVWKGLWLMLLICPARLFAQSDRPYFSLDFARQNDYTYSTNQDAWIRWESGKYHLDMRIAHSNIYNSSLDQDRFVQLYLKSSIWQRYQWKPNLAWVSWIETDQYFNNRNEKVNLYAGVRYQPWEFLSVTPLLGYSFDVRTSILGQTSAAPRLDQGFSPAVWVVAQKTWKDQSLSTTTEAFVRHKFIDPRRQTNVILKHAWDKRFTEGVQLRAGVAGGVHELDDYQGNSVKRILSDTLKPSIQLSYLFAKDVEWQSDNSFLLFRRRFLFDGMDGFAATENDLTFLGMEFQTLQRIGIVRKSWRASASYEYQHGTRVYDLDNSTNMSDSEYENRLLSEKEKDFMRNYHKVDLMTELRLNRRQSLSTRIQSQYMQYDTQSETNFDDRDELSYLGSLDWLGRWNRDFHTQLGISGNYRHYAFLFKEKSQENYVQRSLRMEFRYGWNPGLKWRLEGENAVYVTYNVKDFSDFNKTDRSTRNLENQMKVFFRPSKKLEIESSVRRKETHQSYLNWDAFSETTLDTNTITTIEHKYRFHWKLGGMAWFTEAGYKHFEQSKRLKATVMGLDNLSSPASLKQISDQTGPLLSLGMRGKNQATIDLGCWLQVQIRRNKFNRLDSPNFYPNIFQEADLLNTTTAVRPYFTLRTTLYL